MRDWIGIASAVWLAAMNLAAFTAFGVDKSRARRDKWRVRERTLLLLAILGGSLGAILGMYLFHHKTRHWYFRFGLPAILAIQLAAAAALVYLT